MITTTVLGEKFTFETSPKVFSPNQFDTGSRLLVETVVSQKEKASPKSIVDIGCGYGPIGVILAKLYPDSQILMVDNDPDSVDLAQKNIKLNAVPNARAIKADVTYTNLNRQFDLAVSNPPWTKNISVTPLLVKFAQLHLAIGGKFYVVINQTFKTEDLMEMVFGNVKVVAVKDSYKILVSEKTGAFVNDLVTEIKSLLQKYDIRPTPLLSQYFISDSALIEKIVSAAKITKNDQVLEIGPGAGMLTRELAKKSPNIICVEKDDRFAPLLKQILPKNVQIIISDGLDFLRDNPKTKWSKIASNLPFVAADSFLFRLTKTKFHEAILILPEKLAEDLLIGKKYKDSFRVEKLFVAKRAYFFPMPKADSVVMKLTKPK